MGLGQAAQSLTCSPPLDQHHVGPGCPRCWGAFRPWGDTELRSLHRPRQEGRGEGAEPGVRAASPPRLPYWPPPAPQGWGSCLLGGPPAAPPPPPHLRAQLCSLRPPRPWVQAGQRSGFPGAPGLQTPPLCSAGTGRPRPQTHGAPLPTAAPPPGLHGEPPLGAPGSLDRGSPLEEMPEAPHRDIRAPHTGCAGGHPSRPHSVRSDPWTP